MRRTIAFAALTFSLFAATRADAQVCYSGRCYQAPAYPAPAAYPYPPRAYYAPRPAPRPADSPAAFLAGLNAWRGLYGRPPVGWDSTLAAYAATNNVAGHAPHSMAGSGQCWSGVNSYARSLEMWKQSPGHAAILLGARSAVGCSPCPTGMTCNAR